MDPRNVAERIEAIDALDRAAEPVEQLVGRVLHAWRPSRTCSTGSGSGIRCIPCSRICPSGSGRARSCSTSSVAAGPVRLRICSSAWVSPSALPTAAAGVADWSELNKPERRTGLVHAAANLTATALYGLSFLARGRGRRGAGVALAMAGRHRRDRGRASSAVTSRYRRASGANRAADARRLPRTGSSSRSTARSTDDKPTLAHLDGEPLAAVGGRVAGRAVRPLQPPGRAARGRRPGRRMPALSLARQHVPCSPTAPSSTARPRHPSPRTSFTSTASGSRPRRRRRLSTARLSTAARVVISAIPSSLDIEEVRHASRRGARSVNGSTSTSRTGCCERGENEDTAEEIAARTVNKERARAGEAGASRTSTDDISSGRRGGLRSHRARAAGHDDQLYNEAKGRTSRAARR